MSDYSDLIERLRSQSWVMIAGESADALEQLYKFKILVESSRMKLFSKPLISELKTFVATGNSYEAKPGETDDLVMSSLLAVRMLLLLQTYHSDLDTHLRDHSDSTIEPMPFISIMR